MSFVLRAPAPAPCKAEAGALRRSPAAVRCSSSAEPPGPSAAAADKVRRISALMASASADAAEKAAAARRAASAAASTATERRKLAQLNPLRVSSSAPTGVSEDQARAEAVLRGFVAVDASELVRSFQRDAESAGPAEAAPPRRAFSSHAAAASLLGGLQTFDKPGWWGSSQEALQSMAAAVDEEY